MNVILYHLYCILEDTFFYQRALLIYTAKGITYLQDKGRYLWHSNCGVHLE